MKRKTPRAKELRYSCPSCGAKQWALCRTGGWITGFFHAARKDKLSASQFTSKMLDTIEEVKE